MYIPKNFALHELLPRHMYERCKNNEALGWRLFDDRLLVSLDQVKAVFPLGAAIANNYAWGGNREWSGLRTPGSPYYSDTSQHSYGRAADLVFNRYDAREVRKFIIANPDKFPFVKGVEDFKNMSWVHIDTRNADSMQIFRG